MRTIQRMLTGASFFGCCGTSTRKLLDRLRARLNAVVTNRLGKSVDGVSLQSGEGDTRNNFQPSSVSKIRNQPSPGLLIFGPTTSQSRERSAPLAFGRNWIVRARLLPKRG